MSARGAVESGICVEHHITLCMCNNDVSRHHAKQRYGNGFIFCFYAARLGAVVCVSTFLCTTSTAIPFPGVNVSSPMYISTYIYFSSIHVLQTNKRDGDKLSGWSGLADAMRCWLCSQDRISTSSLGFGCSTQPLQGYWHRCLTNAFPRPVRSFCLAKSYNVFPTRCDLQKFNHTLTCCLTIR